MCGICGFAGLPEIPNLKSMVSQIEHRGPDGVGFYEAPGVGLGFARLAINDLVNGMQPFGDSNTGVQVVVNGEIYNHSKLRKELSDQKYIIRSNTDTEVVLSAYLKWGIEAIPKFEGMFALAIWDPRDNSLILARDRLGKKPLYFSRVGTGIVFGSEIKSILESRVSREIDSVALFQYLATDSVPTPRSIFKQINKLKPGNILIYNKENGVELLDFWDPSYSDEVIENPFNSSLKVLETSVQSRLMSDVPVGMFLSSGVDSTLVAALMARNSKSAINSFTLRFQGNYDESENAGSTAKTLGFIHHVVDANLDNLAKQFGRSIEIFDEPLNDPATLPMLLLSEEARNHVKVVLTGDGGDELLIGYPHARLNLKLDGWRMNLANNTPGLKQVLERIPDSGKYFGIGFKAQRFARGFGIKEFAERDLEWRGAFGLRGASKILDRDYLSQVDFGSRRKEIFNHYFDSKYANTYADRWSWWYLRSYLMDTVLVKVDRATMASGIEARSPLLDHKFVESIFGLQDRYVANTSNKKLFFSYLQEINPSIKIPKSKHGMGVPVLDLLRGPLNEQFRDLTSRDFINKQGIFSPAEVSRLMRLFGESRVEIRKELWGLFVFQAWYSRWAS